MKFKELLLREEIVSRTLGPRFSVDYGRSMACISVFPAAGDLFCVDFRFRLGAGFTSLSGAAFFAILHWIDGGDERRIATSPSTIAKRSPTGLGSDSNARQRRLELTPKLET
jgi:hypothetical protein